MAKLYRLIFLCLAIGSLTDGVAQQSVSVLETTRPVDPSRYEDIKGSPYLYEVWVPAEIVGSNGEIYHDVLINFNGLTRQIEMKKNGMVSQMNPISYLKVIATTENGTETFFRGIHPDLGAELLCLPYDGQRVKLLKEFSVKKQENEVQTPMRPTVFEKFVPSSEYYIMIDGNITPIKLKKKKIIEALGMKSEIDSFIKKEKINLSTEKGLVKLLNYYESDLI
jgi:hypothetical protein